MGTTAIPRKKDRPASAADEKRKRIKARMTMLLEGLKGDPKEQRETFEYLKKALDEGRDPSARRFP